jgi:hypothetical protein
MNDEMTPFPELISDEAAFALSEALHWLALLCDEKYFGQIRRHMATLDEARPVDPEQPWNRNTPAE